MQVVNDNINEPITARITCCFVSKVDMIIKKNAQIKVIFKQGFILLSFSRVYIKTKQSRQWPDGKQLTGLSALNET